MADYTNSKGLPGTVVPDGAITTPWGRLEPLLSPDQLVSRFLMGIPLATRQLDPVTKKPVVITPENLKDYIRLAVNEAEVETNLTIMPVQYSEKKAYSRQDYEEFGFIQLNYKPIYSIEAMTVRLADGSDIFTFPLTWVETANLVQGQLNLVPLAFQEVQAGTYQNPGDAIIQNTSSSGVFFSALWNRPWVPALFNITYTAGFPNEQVPSFVNELIGIIASIRVLSMLAAINRTSSQSLGVDGLSQSVSTPGPQVYAQRIQELEKQRNLIVKRLRATFNSNFVITAI